MFSIFIPVFFDIIDNCLLLHSEKYPFGKPPCGRQILILSANEQMLIWARLPYYFVILFDKMGKSVYIWHLIYFSCLTL